MGIWWEILFTCVVFTHNYSALWLSFWYNIGEKELFWIAATISGDDDIYDDGYDEDDVYDDDDDDVYDDDDEY